jgi:hypothetical protein
MSDSTKTISRLEGTIRQTVNAEIEQVKEDIIKDAVSSFEKQIRKVVGFVTIDVANYYSIQRSGTDLCITVKHVTD